MFSKLLSPVICAEYRQGSRKVRVRQKAQLYQREDAFRENILVSIFRALTRPQSICVVCKGTYAGVLVCSFASGEEK